MDAHTLAYLKVVSEKKKEEEGCERNGRGIAQTFLFFFLSFLFARGGAAQAKRGRGGCQRKKKYTSPLKDGDMCRATHRVIKRGGGGLEGGGCHEIWSKHLGLFFFFLWFHFVVGPVLVCLGCESIGG